MESEINVEVTVSIDFSHDEMSLLRKSAGQDYVEPRFKRVPDELTHEDVKFLKAAVGKTIEWGDYTEEEYQKAAPFYENLDRVCMRFEEAAF